MYCPKCDHELQHRRLAEVEVDQCLKCQGVWLDLGELPALRRQKNTSYAERVAETAVYDVLSAPCPHCGGMGHMTRLHDLTRPAIVMDTCPVCYGVWLDGGELDKLTESNIGLSFKAFVRDLVD
ncbi:MAG: zf-TFIIB domain-containing protein [Chloroflexota bacterium]